MDQLQTFFNKQSHGVQLTLTAAAASLLTLTTLLSYQSWNRRSEKFIVTKRRSSHVIAIIDDESSEKPRERMDETLVLELLARNIAFFGPEAVTKYRNSFVVVLGAGAIGSWTSTMLVRSGLEHIRIVDKNLVHVSDLTCHAVAKASDVGKSKALIMKSYLADIAPNAKVEAVHEEFTMKNLETMLAGEPDFVVDTLSNVKDKVLLAKYCKEHGIKVVSAMSAGAKADPSLIQVTDISDTSSDPLCRMYRRQLRKYNIDRGVPVVYSIEKTLHVDKEVEDFRTRTLPVLAPVASMFGMSLVTYIIVQITGFTAYKLPTFTLRDGVYARMQKELAAREEFVFGNKSFALDVKDVGYIFDELWQGKSVVSGAQDKALVLTRWNKHKESSLTNTVLMTKEEANTHDKLDDQVDLVGYYGSDIVDRVNKQINLEKKMQSLWDSA